MSMSIDNQGGWQPLELLSVGVLRAVRLMENVGVASALLAQMRPAESSEQLIVDATSLKHN